MLLPVPEGRYDKSWCKHDVETQVVNGTSVAVKIGNHGMILPDQVYGLQVYNHFQEEVPE